MHAVAYENRFIVGEFRRHVKTIGHLSQRDKLIGALSTTRNRNTMMTVVRMLQRPAPALDELAPSDT